MSVSGGSDITIPIQDSPSPPPSPSSAPNNNDPTSSNKDKSKKSKPGKDSPAKSNSKIKETCIGVENVGFEDNSHHGSSSSTSDGSGPQSPKNDKNKAPTKYSQNKRVSSTTIPINDSSDPKIKESLNSPTLHEAVNAELINMSVLDTIPQKPQPEFGPYEKFDDYFISVNQHRKYLRRGEKLYLTKDKRKSSVCKSCIYWLFGAILLAGIITFAVLAGVGLFPQSTTGGGWIFSSSEIEMTTTTQDPSTIVLWTTTTTIPESSPSFPQETSDEPSSSASSISPEIVDGGGVSTTGPTEDGSSSPSPTPSPFPNNYVPSVTEVQLTLRDGEWEEELGDLNSRTARALASTLEDEIKRVLETDGNVGNPIVRVTKFMEGSIIVNLRVGWDNENDSRTDSSTIQEIFGKMSSVGTFELKPGTTRTYPLFNLCNVNNNACSDFCTFDYETLYFLCTCPETMLLQVDGKTCGSGASSTSSTPKTDLEPVSDGPGLVSSSTTEFPILLTSTSPDPLTNSSEGDQGVVMTTPTQTSSTVHEEPVDLNNVTSTASPPIIPVTHEPVHVEPVSSSTYGPTTEDTLISSSSEGSSDDDLSSSSHASVEPENDSVGASSETSAEHEEASGPSETPIVPQVPSQPSEVPIEPEIPSQSSETPIEPEISSQSSETPFDPEVPSKSPDASIEPEVPSQSSETPIEPEAPSQSSETPVDPQVLPKSSEAPIDPEVPSQVTSSEAPLIHAENPVNTTEASTTSTTSSSVEHPLIPREPPHTESPDPDISGRVNSETGIEDEEAQTTLSPISDFNDSDSLVENSIDPEQAERVVIVPEKSGESSNDSEPSRETFVPNEPSGENSPEKFGDSLLTDEQPGESSNVPEESLTNHEQSGESSKVQEQSGESLLTHEQPAESSNVPEQSGESVVPDQQSEGNSTTLETSKEPSMALENPGQMDGNSQNNTNTSSNVEQNSEGVIQSPLNDPEQEATLLEPNSTRTPQASSRMILQQSPDPEITTIPPTSGEVSNSSYETEVESSIETTSGEVPSKNMTSSSNLETARVRPRLEHGSDEFMVFSDSNSGLLPTGTNGNGTQVNDISMVLANYTFFRNESMEMSNNGNASDEQKLPEVATVTGELPIVVPSQEALPSKSKERIEAEEIQHDLTTIRPISLHNDTDVNYITENVTEDNVNTEIIGTGGTDSSGASREREVEEVSSGETLNPGGASVEIGTTESPNNLSVVEVIEDTTQPPVNSGAQESNEVKLEGNDTGLIIETETPTPESPLIAQPQNDQPESNSESVTPMTSTTTIAPPTTTSTTTTTTTIATTTTISPTTSNPQNHELLQDKEDPKVKDNESSKKSNLNHKINYDPPDFGHSLKKDGNEGKHEPSELDPEKDNNELS